MGFSPLEIEENPPNDKTSLKKKGWVKILQQKHEQKKEGIVIVLLDTTEVKAKEKNN